MEYLKGSEPFSFNGTTDYGVLLVQGFTSTPDSFRYLGERFRKAGYHVECPRLPGHCTTWQDLEKSVWQDWFAAEEEALAKLTARAKKVFVMGLSLGGALTLRLAETHPEVRAISIINHALFMGSVSPLAGFLKLFVRTIPAIASDIKDPAEKEIAYEKVPVAGVQQIVKLSRVTRRDLPAYTRPVIIFKSKEDHVVPQKNAPYTYDRIGSTVKEMVWLENSYHVATMDFDKDLIFDKTDAFFKKNS